MWFHTSITNILVKGCVQVNEGARVRSNDTRESIYMEVCTRVAYMKVNCTWCYIACGLLAHQCDALHITRAFGNLGSVHPAVPTY